MKREQRRLPREIFGTIVPKAVLQVVAGESGSIFEMSFSYQDVPFSGKVAFRVTSFELKRPMLCRVGVAEHRFGASLRGSERSNVNLGFKEQSKNCLAASGWFGLAESVSTPDFSSLY